MPVSTPYLFKFAPVAYPRPTAIVPKRPLNTALRPPKVDCLKEHSTYSPCLTLPGFTAPFLLPHYELGGKTMGFVPPFPISFYSIGPFCLHYSLYVSPFLYRLIGGRGNIGSKVTALARAFGPCLPAVWPALLVSSPW